MNVGQQPVISRKVRIHWRHYDTFAQFVEAQELDPIIPSAPSFVRVELKCEKCKNEIHLLITSCPECGDSFRYFQSDLDFSAEILGLASVYVRIIQEIRDSLAEHIEEFNVPVPKRWSAKLECDNGHEFTVEITLPQLSD